MAGEIVNGGANDNAIDGGLVAEELVMKVVEKNEKRREKEKNEEDEEMRLWVGWQEMGGGDDGWNGLEMGRNKEERKKKREEKK